MTVSVSQTGTPPSPCHSSGSESDLLSSASTALRRLHFKSTRHASRGKPNVPKVIVMGSSTTSETTINTSTESANTLITNVTGTGTDDSLDLTEPETNALECEPLISDDVLMDSEVPPTPDTPMLLSKQAQNHQQVVPNRTNGPSTAPPGCTHHTRFPFDPSSPIPATPKSSNKDVFDSPTPRSPRHGNSRTAFPFDTPDLQKNNAKFTFDDNSCFSRSSSKKSSRGRTTPALPDLRVDFFKDKVDLEGSQVLNSTNLDSGTPSTSNGSSNEHVRRGTHKMDSAGINVVTNPLDSSVCSHNPYSNSTSGNIRKTPSATIVVQQASLSLDYGQVSTILLKSESDFVSNVSSVISEKKYSKREENMKQLLEVTNALTIEEIRDFEMRYGSPHHSRSQSVKAPGRCMHLSLPAQRSRVASMPNTGTEEEYYRLRHFSITGKGIVNRGDSLKSRRSRSNNSVASSNSSTEHLTAEPRTSASHSLCSSRESSTSQPPYRVLMLGAGAVGKSSLISQFMTSEYLHAYDTSIDDDSGEKSVSVLLAGEESELTFVDIPSSEMSPENCMTSYEAHAYCVVYSMSDRSSFEVAEESLQALWTAGSMACRAVILVANKADLVRCRAVTTEEGKAMATAYDCKFIETSVGINHNVDELLVGLLSQIRLKLENPERSRDLFRKRSTRKNKHRKPSPNGANFSPPASPLQRSGPPTAPSSPRKYRGSRTSTSLRVKGLLGRVWARDSKSKSCENLHVL